MKKTTLLFAFLLLSIISTFSQDRKGTIFYSHVERTEAMYNINVDIFDINNIEYIEVELFDKNEVKLNSNIATLRFKDKKFFMTYNEEETEIAIENITLALENKNNEVEYPMVKVKLLDQNYQIVDFSQKVFY